MAVFSDTLSELSDCTLERANISSTRDVLEMKTNVMVCLYMEACIQITELKRHRDRRLQLVLSKVCVLADKVVQSPGGAA